VFYGFFQQACHLVGDLAVVPVVETRVVVGLPVEGLLVREWRVPRCDGGVGCLAFKETLQAREICRLEYFGLPPLVGDVGGRLGADVFSSSVEDGLDISILT
jgi:hypothetical protein